MSEMKLIMEGWRGFVSEAPRQARMVGSRAGGTTATTRAPTDTGAFDIEKQQAQENTVETFADLQKIVQKTIRLKKAVKAGEITAAQAADATNAALNAATAGAVGVAASVAKKVIATGQLAQLALAAKLPDEQTENNPFLSAFNVDDEYSKIIDDRIESSFINYLAKDIEEKIKTEPQRLLGDYDVNEVLNDFLKQTFDNRSMAGGEKEKAATIKKGAASAAGKGKEKAGGVAKGFFKTALGLEE